MSLSSPSARDLFLQVAALDAGESRERFLRDACAHDQTLRQEVESLLQEEAALGDFLESPAALRPDPPAPVGTSGSGLTTVRSDVESSDSIGPYKLLQEIGEGGCGVVYLAEQESPVRRRVALKVIKLGMDTKSVIARFESERQALALMDHPNIAKVLDAGTTERGRPYFVMELVRGVRITEYCNQHRLTLQDRLHLFIQVSQAIQHAHQKGIIHRDIKPSNILVTWNNALPVPKIIDFGIAKATEQRLTDKTLFTEIQAFMGTPAYMSPEQAEMKGLDIDTRSDIYALGVLLYELLVGTTPFAASELHDQGLDAYRLMIREIEPPRPSQRVASMDPDERAAIAKDRRLDPNRIAQELRGDLDWIVMKCLEKDRQRRYATASALAEDVQHFLAGDLVTARPPSTVYRLRKTVKRHRVAVSAAALIIFTLFVAVLLTSWQALRATRAEADASAAKEEQQRLREEAEHDREQAVISAARAESSAARARMNEYVAEMNLAHQAFRDGNLGRAAQLVAKHRDPADNVDLRGFEWRYLHQLCQGDAHLALPSQGGAITAVAFSPDGETLAAAGSRELLLWDVPNQIRIMQLPVAAEALAFAPNGGLLYTGGHDGLRAWNTSTWTSQAIPDGRIRSLDVSTDGHRLLVGTRRRVCLYDTRTWERLWELPEASAPAVFSPSGDQLLTDSNDGLKIWDTITGAPRVTLQASTRLFARTAIFTPDGSTVIAPRNLSSGRGTFILSVWDAISGQEVGTIPSDHRDAVTHTGGIVSLSLSPDGSTLATASMDHSVGLWDLATRSAITILRGHQHEVWGLAFSPQGTAIAAGGKDGSLFLWPPHAPVRDDILRDQGTALALSPDGNRLASLLEDPATLRLFDLRSRTAVRSLPLIQPERPGERLHVAISQDFSTAIQATRQGDFHQWNLATGHSKTLSISLSDVESLTLAADATILIARQGGGQARWWRLSPESAETPDLVKELPDLQQALLSADGLTLVTLHQDGSARVWDTQTAEERHRFLVRGGGQSVALSPDGALLATTGSWRDSENSVWLWSVATGEPLGELAGHKQSVASLAFSADSQTLASSSYDSSLKFWHLATSQELLSVRRVGTTLHRLQFSPDGQWLVADAGGPFSLHGEIHLFHAPSPQT